MASSEDLIEMKTKLGNSETALKKDIDDAKINLKVLKEDIDTAQIEVNAAGLRYSKLKSLTDKFCDECWDILPTLCHSNASLQSSHHGSQGEKMCVNCNGPWEKSLMKKPECPPDGTDNSWRAKTAVREAGQLMNETISQPGMVDPSQFGAHISDMTWKSFPSQAVGQTWGNKRFLDKGATMKGNFRVPPKSDCLARVSDQKERAESLLQNMKYASSEWSKYKEHHSYDLSKVGAAKKQVDDRERVRLEEERDAITHKLDKLGGKRGRETSRDDSCPICMDKPKRIVFQCGHMTCATCANNISRCHGCRATITQRITLHG